MFTATCLEPYSVLDGKTESYNSRITCPGTHSWDSPPGLSGPDLVL